MLPPLRSLFQYDGLARILAELSDADERRTEPRSTSACFGLAG